MQAQPGHIQQILSAGIDLFFKTLLFENLLPESIEARRKMAVAALTDAINMHEEDPSHILRRLHYDAKYRHQLASVVRASMDLLRL